MPVANMEIEKELLEDVLNTLTQHTKRLAGGLQSVAPSTIEGPSNSILYLSETGKQLEALSTELHQFLYSSESPLTSTEDYKNKWIEIMQRAIAQDQSLRDQYQIKEKFRFISESLSKLLSQIEQGHKLSESKKKIIPQSNLGNEILVYVHIYNAQGENFHTWQKMLIPSLFYEYSINRPIYSKKEYIDSLVRSKKPPAQHGYLTVAVSKESVFLSDENTAAKDVLGNPLIKIKEGSLKIEKLIAFTHENQDYQVNEKEELEKKS